MPFFAVPGNSLTTLYLRLPRKMHMLDAGNWLRTSDTIKTRSAIGILLLTDVEHAHTHSPQFQHFKEPWLTLLHACKQLLCKYTAFFSISRSFLGIFVILFLVNHIAKPVSQCCKECLDRLPFI